MNAINAVVASRITHMLTCPINTTSGGIMEISPGFVGVNSERRKIPFTTYDFGWVVLCIGMAIGSGIIFMPVQVGLKGLWVFLGAVALSYPAVYHIQNLFLRTLIQSGNCEDYTSAISYYLGKNWGVALGLIYFVMLFAGIVTYASSIAHDSASYLNTFGVSQTSLSSTWWYGLILMAVLVAISAQGERVLFRVAGPMVVAKFGIIVILAMIMVPYWDLTKVSALSDATSYIRDVLLTLPFALFSILYVQILNPMNIAYRKLEPDPYVAAMKSVRVNRIAYVVLVVAVLFFTISFAFTVSKADAENALAQNISALAIAAKVVPGSWVKIMSVTLNIAAILSAFFGIYLGFMEALKGVVRNLLKRLINFDANDSRAFNFILCIMVVLMLWVWIQANFSTVLILQVIGPVYGITTCLVPCYLIWKVESLKSLRSKATYYVVGYGVLLIISPFLKFFE
ncbi:MULTISPECIES: amino acid permease [Pseudomonas putida group]|uniref:amino acid permease n=1 Tax=Pseudomonas putida group TaxID=136845 RepID=UPI001E582FA3|nr:amino acid permease [Pseudomonas putida]